MDYKYMSEEEQHDLIAQNLLAREREHFHYELNKQNYEDMLNDERLASLPEEWPTELLPYRSPKHPDEVARLVTDPEQYQLIVNLQWRDRVRLLLKTTLTEQAKTEATYAALEKRIKDPTARDAAVARVVAAEAAKANMES